MSIESWALEKNLCRCCHSQGDFKNLSEPYLEFGQEEIYVDMIKNCFFIDVVPVPGSLCEMTYTICNACIISLRDATKFRKQVADCEEKFQELWSKNAIKVEEPVIDLTLKEEVPESGPEDNISLGGNDSDELSDFNFEDDKFISEEPTQKKSKKVPIKPTKAKPRPKGQSRSRSKKTKKDPPPEEEEGEGAEDGKTKDNLPPKFYLKDGDYTVDGAIFSCTRCEKKYDKYFSLRYHVKTKHYKIPKFLCPYCKKAFMTPAPLTIHKLQEHNIDDRFKCNACKGTFNTKLQLKKHINNFHMLGERYSCEFCEYESFSFEAMYKHKFRHKTSKDHECRFCRKAFVRKTTLALHERIHTGDRRKVCSVCGQAFVQKASLNYHMTKYHPEVNF